MLNKLSHKVEKRALITIGREGLTNEKRDVKTVLGYRQNLFLTKNRVKRSNRSGL